MLSFWFIPQMSPMPWVFLLLVVLVLILVFSTVIYFYKLEFSEKSTSKSVLNQEGWKW